MDLALLPLGIQLATIVSLRNGNPWDITSGSFTTYTTARDARQIQWGARFQF